MVRERASQTDMCFGLGTTHSTSTKTRTVAMQPHTTDTLEVRLLDNPDPLRRKFKIVKVMWC